MFISSGTAVISYPLQQNDIMVDSTNDQRELMQSGAASAASKGAQSDAGDGLHTPANPAGVNLAASATNLPSASSVMNTGDGGRDGVHGSGGGGGSDSAGGGPAPGGPSEEEDDLAG